MENRAKRKQEKRDIKRRELSASVIQALCQAGYAKTSLRDIAAASGHPLGTYHYYFGTREELIIYCVKQHKFEFLDQMRHAAFLPGQLEDVIEALSEGLTAAAIYDSARHRLWFDIRNQALYEPSLRNAIREIDEETLAIIGVIQQRFLERQGKATRDDALVDYAAMDGLFRELTQDTEASLSAERAKKMFRRLLEDLWLKAK